MKNDYGKEGVFEEDPSYAHIRTTHLRILTTDVQYLMDGYQSLFPCLCRYRYVYSLLLFYHRFCFPFLFSSLTYVGQIRKVLLIEL